MIENQKLIEILNSKKFPKWWADFESWFVKYKQSSDFENVAFWKCKQTVRIPKIQVWTCNPGFIKI